MRILHVLANLAPRYGGPPKACFEMARSTAKLGHALSIYTTNQDGPTELNVPTDSPVYRDGVEICYFPIQHPRFWGFSLPLALQLRSAVKEHDIVHIHSLYLFHDLVAPHYCRKYDVPYLITPHGTLDPVLFQRHRLRKRVMELAFEDRNFKHAAAIHFTAEEEERSAKAHTLGAPGIVIPIGLDLAEYENLPAPGTFRARYPETRGKKIILFLGRINFKKGLDILVQAFSAVAQSRDDVHLVIAGPDNDGFEKKVHAWLRDEKVHDRTTFTGMLEGDDKLAVLGDADVFVLPSYDENFGFSVVEAMVCGVPVIISDKVAIWPEVETGGAGKVVPCDVNRFAEGMLSLLNSPDVAQRMGENGKTLVRKRFQWSSVALDLETAYRSIVSGSIPNSCVLRT
jgi:glycosyltransferase involved in cell wall biosynthesis